MNGDGVGFDLDCDETDADVWGTPGEVVLLAITGDKETFLWEAIPANVH